MRMIHVYSRADDWRPHMVHSATLHAGEQAGHSTVGVESVDNLKQTLRRIVGGPELDAMDFHTHGHAGSVNLGQNWLNVNALDGFRGEGFDAIFKAGARVEFLGCNIAEQAVGELFLAEFGSIFLRRHGGEVLGSTSVGFQDPLYTGEIPHFWGVWVTAEVFGGGAVRMRNHRHLHPHLIRREIGRLRELVESRLTNRPRARAPHPGSTGLDEWALLDVAQQLDQAESYLDLNGGRPSYRFVYHAYDSLSRAHDRYVGNRPTTSDKKSE
jgi:hypothetical protein